MMRYVFLTLIYFCLFKHHLFQNKKDEEKIESLIMKNYDKSIRPSDYVTVSLRLQLKQIINVNEINQIITTSSYFYLSWYDPRLIWPQEINYPLLLIRIQAIRLWLPDLYILNTADSNGFISSAVTNSSYALVAVNGSVYLVIGLMALNTRCPINIKKVLINLIFIFKSLKTISIKK